MNIAFTFTRHLVARTRLAAAILGSAAQLSSAEPAATAASPAGKHPNILYIITDQQNSSMLSCAGNPYVKTPALDSLAATGARFAQAYCVNPVCMPSRTGMFMGIFPSRLGIEVNGEKPKGGPPAAILDNSMGRIFAKAGYETVYGGKVHLPATLEQVGFREIEKDEGPKLADTCVKFLRGPHEKPFLLVASFINPHDICFMAIRNLTTPEEFTAPEPLVEAMKMPPGMSREDFYGKVCPPLPANYAIPPGEPEALLAGDQRPFRRFVRDHWSDEQWRLHRWAYARLTEYVDAQIALVLQALRDTGLDQDTLVVFSVDHGDMDSSHHLEHKSVLYDEAARVPFIVSWKGVTKPGLVDNEHLVSSGQDLIPTLCDFAGVPQPPALKGRSVRALAEGRAPDSWRETLVTENGSSRMLRSAQYKYVVYPTGARREQLTDMKADPGEMRNLALEPEFTPVLEKHRRLLREWYEQNGETLDPKYIVTGNTAKE